MAARESSRKLKICRSLSPEEQKGITMGIRWRLEAASSITVRLTYPNFFSFPLSSSSPLLIRMRIRTLTVLIVCSLVGSGAVEGQQNKKNRARLGEWSKVYKTPLVPVAAANLPDGRIVYWSAFNRFDFRGEKGATATAIFNPRNGKSTARQVQNTDHDMFCPGTATLEDGRILITGGSNAAAVTIYNPATNRWTKETRMKVSRGYHTMTALHDGSVFTVGGSFTGGRGGKHAELWEPDSGTWHPLFKIDTPPLETDDNEGVYRADNHMWLFQSPNKRIFHAGPSRQMHWLDIRGTNGNGKITKSKTRGKDPDSMNGNAVMYSVGKLLTLGGAENYSNGPANDATHMIDIRKSNVKVRRVGKLNHARALCNSVVLPSGEVVVFGGQSSGKL